MGAASACSHHAPFGNAQDTFEKLKQLAGITDDLRIHDLRHTYASIAIYQGATLYEVQHLLGHSNSQTTQRYAHMAKGCAKYPAKSGNR